MANVVPQYKNKVETDTKFLLKRRLSEEINGNVSFSNQTVSSVQSYLKML